MAYAPPELASVSCETETETETEKPGGGDMDKHAARSGAHVHTSSKLCGAGWYPATMAIAGVFAAYPLPGVRLGVNV